MRLVEYSEASICGTVHVEVVLPLLTTPAALEHTIDATRCLQVGDAPLVAGELTELPYGFVINVHGHVLPS